MTGGVDKYVSGTKGLFVGNRVNAFYDYKVLGEWGIGEFDQYVEDFKAAHEGKKPGCTGTKGYGTPGSPKILDKDGDGTISSDDRVLYNQDPNHVFGMTNTFTYKDFSLSVQLMARLGGYISYAMNEQLNYRVMLTGVMLSIIGHQPIPVRNSLAQVWIQMPARSGQPTRVRSHTRRQITSRLRTSPSLIMCTS